MLTSEQLGLELGMDLNYLWAHQPEAIEHLTTYKKCILPLIMGTGKTPIALLTHKRAKAFPLLILCSGNALYTWWKHIKQYYPEYLPYTRIVEKDVASAREAIWNDPTAEIIIAKAKTFLYDRKHGLCRRYFKAIVCDEFHRYLRKRGSQMFHLLKEYAAQAQYFWFLSGTPIWKGRQDYWPLLHILNPQKFSSYWRFVDKFCHVVRGQFGMEILGPRNTEAFRELTKGEIFRPSQPIKLPAIVRQTLPVEMYPAQAKAYNQIKDEMLLELVDGGLMVTSHLLAQITRLRQLCCCPAILDPKLGYGAGVLAVLDHMEEAEDRQHCVWFTPFVDAIPHMQKALRMAGYEKTVVFQSGMSMRDLEEAEVSFRLDRETIAIVSIQYAQSFELETGNPGYFIGYDWYPGTNAQAEGRQRRKTRNEDDSINMFYVQNLGTYDDKMLEDLSMNTLNTQVDMNDARAIKNILNVGTQ